MTPRITTTPTVTDTINTILVSPSGVDESPVDKIGVREVKKARFLDELETQMTLNAKVDVNVVAWDDYEMRAMGGWMGLVLYEDFTPRFYFPRWTIKNYRWSWPLLPSLQSVIHLCLVFPLVEVAVGHEMHWLCASISWYWSAAHSMHLSLFLSWKAPKGQLTEKEVYIERDKRTRRVCHKSALAVEFGESRMRSLSSRQSLSSSSSSPVSSSSSSPAKAYLVILTAHSSS